MCELFGMSARHPATVNLSLDAFAHHGSRRGLNKDGWGIALYRERDVRLVKEPAPAEGSDIVRFIEGHALPSSLVIAHIRHATAGGISYSNTHPFVRELGGRMHTFAHNGKVDALDGKKDLRLAAARFRPVGQTDSERLFCELLMRLEPLWLADTAPSLGARRDVVEAFAREARERGIVNFLYSDGDALFAHSHFLPHPDSSATTLPGLHALTRTCAVCDSGFKQPGIAIHPGPEGEAEQVATLVATVPLSDEPWRPLGTGELLVLKSGSPLHSSETRSLFATPPMLMRSSLLLAIAGLTFLGACAAPSTAPGEETATTFAESVANAYGLDAFEQLDSLSYTFNVQIGERTFARSWVWEPKLGRVTLQKDGGETKSYLQSDVAGDPDLKEIDAAFINDQYWLVFPFELVWADKLDLELSAGLVDRPMGAGQARRLTATFRSGGYTPGDAYDLYVGPDMRVLEWVFRKGASPEPTRATRWTDYQDFAGLQLALDRPGDDGFRVWFTGVEAR